MEKEYYDEIIFDIAKNDARNIKVAVDILKKAKKSSLYKAYPDIIREPEDALKECKKHGATIDKEFLEEFNIHFASTTLSIISILLLDESIQNDREAINYLIAKADECLGRIEEE